MGQTIAGESSIQGSDKKKRPRICYLNQWEIKGFGEEALVFNSYPAVLDSTRFGSSDAMSIWVVSPLNRAWVYTSIQDLLDPPGR